MDADDSDVAALLQKIEYAHKEKIEGIPKSCRTGKTNEGQDASEVCASFGIARSDEQILLKGCSYKHAGDSSFNSCLALAEHYVDAGRDIEALAALLVPNATNIDQSEAADRKIAGVRYEAYNALGNNEMARKELNDLCYSYGDGHAYTGRGAFGSSSCGLLIRLGESVDVGAAQQRKEAWDAERREEAHQRHADEAEEMAEKAERQQQIVGLVNGLADTAVNSYQQSQADMAQARVNAEAIRLAQQNKGAGGYPTASSGGGSSSSGTSSGPSSKPAAKTSASDASDSSDSPSEPSAASSGSSAASPSADKPFNPYTSTDGGYNPYSGQGVPAAGSTIPGEQGHWADTEMNVTCYSRDFPNTLISAVLTNGRGDPNCNGAFVEFLNPDKTHPFFYGFAGVVNERMEANSTRDIRWPAPYLYKDQPNPAFVARVSIRYFAAN